MIRILVVDDNRAILEVVKVILEGQSYVVETTPYGSEAFDLAISFRPSLILLDVFLSGRDGRQICRKLKSSEITRDIPVIMFSAQSKMEDVLMQCNANDFIAKPFDVAELLGKVDFHIKRAASMIMED